MIEWWQAILGLMTALGARELLAKMVDRKATAVATDKVKVETRANEVDILREVLDEVRKDSSDKSSRIERLEERMTKLEERERHQLTRAAVHEAWDSMAFAFIVQHNPNHPPPPPLTIRQLAGEPDATSPDD